MSKECADCGNERTRPIGQGKIMNAKHDWAAKKAEEILGQSDVPLVAWLARDIATALRDAARVPEGCVRIDLNRSEHTLLVGFLSDYGDRLGNAGCNDLQMPDTSEHRAIVTAAQNDDQELLLTASGDIITFDFQVVGYLRRKIEAALAQPTPARGENTHD